VERSDYAILPLFAILAWIHSRCNRDVAMGTKISKLIAVIGIIAVLVVVIALIFIEVRIYGTGFTGKTLWDWLQLLAALAIPLVVGFGAVWFTIRQGKVADAENKDNQRETALQVYIDKMSELLLDKQLRDSSEEDEVRKVARVRTLTVLSRLDSDRKRSVLQFLYESGLIDKDRCIIDLSGGSSYGLDGADLYEADLFGVTLSGASLRGVRLGKANMIAANLSGANLSRAYLYDADLQHADLSGANLSFAKVDVEQLKKASSLKGATMPDGSIHP
jgi:hypothetical protein